MKVQTNCWLFYFRSGKSLFSSYHVFSLPPTSIYFHRMCTKYLLINRWQQFTGFTGSHTMKATVSTNLAYQLTLPSPTFHDKAYSVCFTMVAGQAHPPKLAKICFTFTSTFPRDNSRSTWWILMYLSRAYNHKSQYSKDQYVEIYHHPNVVCCRNTDKKCVNVHCRIIKTFKFNTWKTSHEAKLGPVITNPANLGIHTINCCRYTAARFAVVNLF